MIVINPTTTGGGVSPVVGGQSITPLLDLSGVPDAPVFAGSFNRQLRSSYSGALFRLYDSADTSTYDISPTASKKVDMDEVVAACKTDTTTYYVDRLYDQGTQGNDASQSIVSSMPRYKYATVGQPNDWSYQWFAGGYPAPQFDGVDSLQTSALSTPSGSLYCYAVLNCKDWYLARYNAILGIGYSATTGIGIHARTGGASAGWSNGDAACLGDGYNTGREPRVHDGLEYLTVQYGTPVILEFLLQDGGSDEIRINGRSVVKEANSAAVPALTSQIMYLARTGSGSDYLLGQMAEVVLWVGTEASEVPDSTARNLIFENVNSVFNCVQLTPNTWS